jgi:transposase
MWPAYIRATTDGLPQGDQKIVFDRFHIMQEMTRAVDTVRKQEHRAFLKAGGTRSVLASGRAAPHGDTAIHHGPV